MAECKVCGAENSENAIYCKKCGKRLDGLVPCPVCKSFVDADSVFCNYCGSRVDGKRVCEQCGSVLEGEYCTRCGSRAVPKKPQVRRAPQGASSEQVSGFRRLMLLISGGVAMGAVLFSLIFVFLIGVSMRGKMTGGDLDGIAAQLSEVNLYYYFGKIYSEIATSLDLLPEYSGLFALSNYLPAVFGTLIAAATVICTVVFSILAIVRYVQFALGRSEKSAEKMAAAAFLSFAGGAALLTALSSAVFTVQSSFIKMGFTYSANGATVSGLVLGGIFLAMSVLCAFASKGKELLNVATIVKSVLSLVAIVFAVAALGCASGLVGLRIDESGSATYVMKFGYMMFGGIFGIYCESYDSADMLGSEGISTFAFGLIWQLLSIVTVILAALTIVSLIGNLLDDEKKPSLAKSISLTVLALATMVFGILAVRGLGMLMIDETVSGTFSFAQLVVCLVMSVLSMAAVIAHRIYGNTQLKQEPDEEIFIENISQNA